MPGPDAAAALHASMVVALKLCTPLLVASLIAGLAIAVLQAITQISDTTLSFLPKLIACCAAGWLAGPFMAAILRDFMHATFERLIQVGGQ